MITTYLFSKSIKTQITLPLRWLHITLNVLRSNSSSSDSSSDSDSDSESFNKNTTGKNRNIVGNSDDITSLTHNVKNQKLKYVDYLQAAKEKQKRKQIGKQLTKAADVLTTTVEPNREKVLSSLLDNISTIRNENSSKALHRIVKTEFKQPAKKSTIRMWQQEHKITSNVNKIGKLQRGSSIIWELQEEQERKSNINKTERESNINKTERESNINKTERESNINKTERKDEVQREPSIIRMLQEKQEITSDTTKFERNYRNNRGRLSTIKTAGIQKTKIENIDKDKTKTEKRRYDAFTYCEQDFTNDFANPAVVPELKIWNLCEEKELQLITTLFPKNGFEEMIQWTQEGKLWKFPIDNEQGMEKEYNVHFSKHVFLERHLENWCPLKGPIRYFMELVCIGLSKNPYMTIEEKQDHIMWYKDYFNDKRDLLQKLGLAE